jgi:hypothetical protein
MNATDRYGIIITSDGDNPWFTKPKPRRKVTDLVAVRFVGITALAAVIGLPIWWTGWHLLDRYLGWIWT